MDPKNQTADPNASSDPAVVADPNVGSSAQEPGATENAGDPTKPHGNAGKTPWYMTRINEETNKRRELENQAADAMRRANDAEALLSRLQQDDKAPAGEQQPKRQGPTQEQYANDIMREASRLRFYEDSAAVKTAGVAKFGASFSDMLNTLTAIGATTDDFVLDVLTVDKVNAHVILKTLADEPERAASLAGMNSRQRIAELTRMAMAEPQKGGRAAQDEPTARAVSRAPAPKPIIQPSASANEGDWMDPEKLDKMSEDEANAMFSSRWNEKYLPRKSA